MSLLGDINKNKHIEKGRHGGDNEQWGLTVGSGREYTLKEMRNWVDR